ncbi:MAG: gamma carbonic anhydrase family protein [Elusimicrobiota bacterium]|nr:gamma carbonic anhydrase family protein [Elusimicrobiota bacterium]
MIRDFKGIFPEIAQNCYVAPSAVIIGRVKIAEKASVWPGSVLRGDVERIEIKEKSNIQDGAVIHTSPGYPVLIESGVTVGHRVILHGTHIKSSALIGMGAILLDGSVVNKESIVAAGSLVPEGKTVESGWLYMGTPAVKKRELKDSEKAMIFKRAQEYVQLAGLNE